jgi:hypothetical protein
MIVLLSALTVFNIVIAYASTRRAFRLVRPEGRARWASKRLYGIAVFVAWTLPIVSLAGVAAGWAGQQSGAEHTAAPLMLAGVAWILVWGVLFAIVDVLEDGELDFGRGAKRQKM